MSRSAFRRKAISSTKWLLILAVVLLHSDGALAQEAAPAVKTVPVWSGNMPAWTAPTEPEQDTSGPNGRDVAGKSVIRLGNVSKPELHLYPFPGSENTVIVNPGGGYSILAWDLEGTEIAQWLQSIGVSAVVLKYRVPTRNEEKNWLPPVQDIQRSVSLLRSGAIDGFQPKRIGVLGFSAGGNASARAATATQRHYEPIDAHDQASAKPDFAVLVYPAWLADKEDESKLIEDLTVSPETPPMFFAHAGNDRISCMSSVTLFTTLRANKVPAELHVFANGGHGFGARDTGESKDHWPALCESWMRDNGWLK
ncbi:alpha/beta hydrolase [Stieleria varia]|uniref:Acetylxylan esterase n=1 Tax=Stieleria varia TaxID=2528005 RepID=A0A5C6AT31_9BACT|nr:alpha/beta hydrolase [Stieleria varia]TWU01304.1 Acetylxylan esterase precursor [Stieleria varia]